MDKYIITAPLVILDEFHSREISKMDYLIKENRSECIELFTKSKGQEKNKNKRITKGVKS